jgi:hypothetical protein
MTKIVTTRYDVTEHLRSPEEMVACLEACLEEADGDAAFIAKALGDITREMPGSPVKVFTRRYLAGAVRASITFSRSSGRSD